MLNVEVSHVLGPEHDAFPGDRVCRRVRIEPSSRLWWSWRRQFDDDAIAEQRVFGSANYWLMNEKRRCSILFHLLVPGGR